MQKKRYYAQTAFLYAKRPWTAEEDARILERAVPDRDLSKELQRSMRAICNRRGRLRKREKEKNEWETSKN